MSLTATIKTTAETLGFDAVGIARVAPRSVEPSASSPHLRQLAQRLTDWLHAGYHATMAWLARDPARRADPRLVLPGCRSMIVVGMNYDTGHRPDERPGTGRIARYAWGRDYHQILGERLAALTAQVKDLAPESESRWYVDTGPVMEKAWAQEAGLGWIGKHSNLVSAQHGSWLLLGEILTTLELDPDTPGSDLCGSCTLCIHACPTGAIPSPYVVDAGRCISYLTIEHRTDDISDDLVRRMGPRIFGCDDCLDVCPYNTQASPTHRPDFQPLAWTLRPMLASLEQMTETEFLALTQDSPLRRPKFRGFLRNVRQALLNAGRHASSPVASNPD